MSSAAVSSPYALCALVEFLLLMGSLKAAAVIRLGWGGASEGGEQPLWLRGLVAALIIQLCFYYGELYENQGLRRRVELFFGITRCVAVGALALVTVFFAVPGLQVGSSSGRSPRARSVTACSCSAPIRPPATLPARC